MEKKIFAVFLLLLPLSYRVTHAQTVLDFHPSNVTLHVRSETTFTLAIRNCTDDNTDSQFTVEFKREDVRVLNSIPPLTNLSCGENYTVPISSGMMGFTSLTVSLTEDGREVNVRAYTVGVTPAPGGIIGQVFCLGTAVGVALLTFGFGVEIDLQVVKNELKRPIAPVIGVIGQFVIMPLLAFGLSVAGKFHPAIQLGLLVFAAAPGGGASNIVCYLWDANLSLSITMTLISTVGSFGMTTMWLLTLGKYITEGSDIHIPYTSILQSLALLIIPLGIGMLIARFLPRVAKVLIIAEKVIVVLVTIHIVVLGLLANFTMFEYVFLNWQLLLSGMAIPIIGAILSGGTAAIFKREWKDVKCIATETAIQSMQVGIVILTFSLETPWREITQGIPVILGIVTVLPLLVGGFIRVVILKFRQKKTEKSTHPVKHNNDIKLSDSRNGGALYNNSVENDTALNNTA